MHRYLISPFRRFFILVESINIFLRFKTFWNDPVWSYFKCFNQSWSFDSMMKGLPFGIIFEWIKMDLSDIKINILSCILKGISSIGCFLHLRFLGTWYFLHFRQMINFQLLHLSPSWPHHFHSKDFQSTIKLLRKLSRKTIWWKFWKLLYVSFFIMIVMSGLLKGLSIGFFCPGRGFHDVFKWKY